MKKFIIITSIFSPTEAVSKFSKLSDWEIIVVGDLKTDPFWQCPNVTYLSPEEQNNFAEEFSVMIPWNSYTRKNVGYLYAISKSAEIIYETDDDNLPLDNWNSNPFLSNPTCVLSGPNYYNIYKQFTEEHVWPRGFPLNLILENQDFSISNTSDFKVGIWQFLADEDPDVDAIYRLTSNKPIYFDNNSPLILDAGTVCPFNSQNTYFNRDVFPLLYLPSTVTFRFTDILRGLIAQPILWAAKRYLAFGPATVIQKRNPHDFMRDFESEIPCYLDTERVIQLVTSVVSDLNSIETNLIAAYSILAEYDIVDHVEIDRLKMWLNLLRV